MEPHELIKHGMDAVSFTTTIAALTGMLPPIASLLSIIWLLCQITSWVRRELRGGK